MRIACYGLVDKEAGSVASANFMVLKEMLKRGHSVDFYAKEDFVRPTELFASENFNYRGVLLRGYTNLWRRIKPLLGSVIGRIVEGWLYNRHLMVIQDLVDRAHEKQPYDMMLFLGLEPQFEVQDLPTVSWLQGPPQTEWKAIRRRRDQLIRLSGRLLYWKLKLFYAYKQSRLRRRFEGPHHFICGSEWSRAKIVEFGVSPEHVHVLPYPFDLDLFKPERESERLHPGRHTLLWLGRIDPRKRLDLMLDAFELLLEERRDVHLEIVGRLNYAPEYSQLVDAFPLPDHVSYRDHVDRAEVPALLNAVDAVVQPSEDENFGSSVAEALCCGKPVILGPRNGTGDYCGEAAFRFDDYTSPSLMRAMSECLSEIAKNGEALRERARRIAEREFSVVRVVDGIESIGRRRVSNDRLSTVE